MTRAAAPHAPDPDRQMLRSTSGMPRVLVEFARPLRDPPYSGRSQRVCTSLRPRGLAIAVGVGLLGMPVPAQIAATPSARQAAIHPIRTVPELQAWLARVPVTRSFPDDYLATMRAGATTFTLEMSTAPGCVPCADLWSKLGQFHSRSGWTIATLAPSEAMLRSGRLGLPWVGDPVLWVRAIEDPRRAIPVAIGTDLYPNVARNIYLATKILTGVRVDVGVRAMAKFTGLVASKPRDPSEAGMPQR